MQETSGARLGVVLVALFVVALFLYFIGSIAEIVVLLFMAAILGTYFGAFTDTLVRFSRLPRALSLTVATLVTLFAVVGIGALIVPPVIAQTEELLASLPELGRRLEGTIQRLSVRYPGLGLPATGGESTFVERLMGEATGRVGESMFPYITAGGKVVIEMFSVLAMAIYFARDPASYREGLIALVPPRARHIARRTLSDLNDTIRAWIGGQLMAMFFLAAVTAVGLWLLRVPYALAFGVFTGAVALVPFFGTIASTLLPASFVLGSGGWGQAFAVLLLGIFVHLVEANIVYPLIFHVRIKLPPVMTILSVLVAASVLGILGLVVAVPLLATIMVIVRHVLVGQIYGDTPAGARVSAVLVPTQEYRRSLGLR